MIDTKFRELPSNLEAQKNRAFENLRPRTDLFWEYHEIPRNFITWQNFFSRRLQVINRPSELIALGKTLIREMKKHSNTHDYIPFVNELRTLAWEYRLESLLSEIEDFPKNEPDKTHEISYKIIDTREKEKEIITMENEKIETISEILDITEKAMKDFEQALLERGIDREVNGQKNKFFTTALDTFEVYILKNTFKRIKTIIQEEKEKEN